MKDFSLLEGELAGQGMTLTEGQKQSFVSFYEAMVEKNKVMNLTAITEWDEVLLKHFCDSLTLLRCVDLKGEKSLMDVGTGAGFPGIPLKILFPEAEMTLMDSLQKRILFLEEIKALLGLENLRLLHGRAEEAGRQKELREHFDVCVSRAVSQLSVLSEYCLPFVKVGGVFVSYKSADCEEEVQAAKKAIHLLGGKVEEVKRFTLPGSDMGRALVVIRKVSATPGKYPRKAGTPAKMPLGTEESKGITEDRKGKEPKKNRS